MTCMNDSPEFARWAVLTTKLKYQVGLQTAVGFCRTYQRCRRQRARDLAEQRGKHPETVVTTLNLLLNAQKVQKAAFEWGIGN